MVNKSDLLVPTPGSLRTLLESRFPGRDVSFVSCKSGDGVAGWLTDVMEEGVSGSRILEIDYDTYAEGKAALGWLNARLELAAAETRDWIALAEPIWRPCGDSFKRSAQVGHIKVFLRTEPAA